MRWGSSKWAGRLTTGLLVAFATMLVIAASAYAEPVESFSGKVTFSNSSAVPSATVEVHWWDTVGGTWYVDAWTLTDELGNYSISDVMDGRTLAVYFPAHDGGRYQAEYYNNASGLDRAMTWTSANNGLPVGPYTNINATLEPTVGALGSVTCSGTGEPMGDVTVTLERRPWSAPAPTTEAAWTPVKTTTTNGHGEYLFMAPVFDDMHEYRVAVRVDGYLPAYGGPWVVQHNVERQEMHLSMVEAAPLATGKVTNAADWDHAFAGVTVYVADPLTGEHIGAATTDENGMYVLPYRAQYGDVPFNFKFKAYKDGYQYTWVGPYTYDGTVTVQKDFSLVRTPTPVIRVSAGDRFGVAAGLARKGWDPSANKTWPGVTSIIIANGEDGREADPLCAAPLAGVLDAPVLLVKSTGLPSATKAVVAEIAAKNPGVRIYLIGGAASVPDSIWATLKTIKGVSTVKTRLAGPDRYSTSVAIAKKTVELRAAQVSGGRRTSGYESGVMLVAGDNPAAFYDALAASPGAFAAVQPMLAVKRDSVPPVVKQALAGNGFAGRTRFVVSGPAYISSTTLSQAGGVSKRLTTSSDRYTASTEIANSMMSYGWVEPYDTGVAAKLPDALAGGAFMGKRGGVMLFSGTTPKTLSTLWRFVAVHELNIKKGWIIGGELSVSRAVETTFRAILNHNGQ